MVRLVVVSQLLVGRYLVGYRISGDCVVSRLAVDDDMGKISSKREYVSHTLEGGTIT